MTDREILGQITEMMKQIRLPEEDAVIISIGSHKADYDCPAGFSSATVRVGEYTATSHAVHIHDAIGLARVKAKQMALDAAESGERRRPGRRKKIVA